MNKPLKVTKPFLVLFGIVAIIMASAAVYGYGQITSVTNQNTPSDNQVTPISTSGMSINAPQVTHLNVIITIDKLSYLRGQAIHLEQDGILYTIAVHNIVTNIGKNYSVGQIFGSPTTAAQYIGWSNDNNSATPSATWTCINNTVGSEINTAGLTRAVGSYTLLSGNTGNCTITKAFSVTGTLGNITMIGLFYSASSQADNTMIACASISSTNVANGDTLNGTWIGTIS